MELAEFYEIEGLRRQAIISGNSELADQYSYELYQKTCHLPHLVFLNSFAMPEVLQTHISQSLINDIALIHPDETHQEVDQAENFYRSYVERLLNVDLSKVEILRAAGNFKHAEGRAVTCRATDHLVILPPRGEEYVSPDLLIHELGHTAEYTLRRASNDIEMLRSHLLFSEAIAHFCQYKYMVEFGTRTERLHALASVTKNHMLLRALRAHRELRDQPANFQVSRIIDHEYLDVYRAAYTKDRIEWLLEDYEGRSFIELYFTEAEPRMGAVLALQVMHNGAAIRELCLMKTNQPVREMLDNLNLKTEELMDFTQADALFRKFVEGTI
ncbi:hypothetical protein JOD97_001974 [Duganella sp. 1411]|uniref:hypothetical protein n=1 Tax=Duganella sp. 1411 TaxID=2806572 RepID=UPI001AEA674C|nr:hypothetical protein [Duganella sp. 1411]MBP1203960.1 hypothetical protein [Duganella sp. 1411]